MEWFSYNINDLTPQTCDKWYNLMTEEKKSHIDQMYHQNDKKRSVAGEMLAKKTIAEHLTIPAEDIVFANGENKKPYAIGCDIEFNISHCQDIVVCAVHDEPVGIDIERIRPFNMKITKKFFSTDEQKYLFGKSPTEDDYTYSTDKEQLKRFFEIWTGKEAYVKYTGEGLIADLANLQFDKSRITTILKDDYVISIYY